MKEGEIYYLRKNGNKTLITSREPNEPITIDIIDDDIVYFHFKNDVVTGSICMVHEFNKIFSNKLNK